MKKEKKSIIIGCDHAAYELKNKIRDFLEKKGFEVTDAGVNGPESSDYPEFGARVARRVSGKEFEKGVLLCGSGIGMSMVANRFPHVRAALCRGLFDAVMSRRHNDANILVLGGRVTGDVLAFEILNAWLETPFEGGRHQGRLDQFDEISFDDIGGHK
jgi:ribose 5-phosphate isomerase B